MYPVRNNYRYQLGYAGKQKVGMEGSCILRPAISEAETVFDVIDGALDGCADLIGGLPFLCPADRSGIKAEVLFRIQIDHSPASGRCTWILAVTDTAVLSVFTFVPAHFRADELEGLQPAAEMGCISFRLHGKGRVMGTAGYSFLIDRVIGAFICSTYIHRDKCPFEDPGGAVLSGAEHIAAEERFIDISTVESGISKKGHRIDQGMLPEEILQYGEEQPCVSYGSVLVRCICFLIKLDFRMGGEIILVIELNGPDNAETVRQDPGLIGIAKMAVEILLFDFLIG